MQQEYPTQTLRKRVLDLINDQDSAALAKIIEDQSSKDIIHLIGHLSRNDQMKLFALLSPEEAAEVMEDIPEAQAVEIIEEMTVEDAAAILNEMESDEQADIIMELDEKDAQAILSEMKPEEAASVRRLMVYDSDVAGGMMHTEYFAFHENRTVNHITEDLRNNAQQYHNYHLKYIFVTATDQTLKGVLQMQDLLLSKPDTPLKNIIVRKVLSIDHMAPLDELIDFFNAHEYYGVPIVDDHHKLIGVVLRRDILEAQTERMALEHLESQGILGGDELRTMPVFLRARRRMSWLSVNILLNIMAASVIAYHQEVLSSVIAMAVFLPIISDMSGCSGNQAVAVSMRELSIGVVNPREVMRVWLQEISVGLINGILLGVLIGIAAIAWKGNIYLGMVVGGALAINTIIAVSIGGTVPLLLKGAGVDPALASGPILTTITDMIGFFLALTFASLALVHLGGL